MAKPTAARSATTCRELRSALCPSVALPKPHLGCTPHSHTTRTRSRYTEPHTSSESRLTGKDSLHTGVLFLPRCIKTHTHKACAFSTHLWRQGVRTRVVRRVRHKQLKDVIRETQTRSIRQWLSLFSHRIKITMFAGSPSTTGLYSITWLFNEHKVRYKPMA